MVIKSYMNAKIHNIVIVILLIVVAGIYKTSQDRIAEKDERLQGLLSMYLECSEDLGKTSKALDEANSSISDAKLYTWESYDEMGEALDNLEEVYP